jgi:hypothetical protein
MIPPCLNLILCVSLGGGWDGVCSPTEVPGKNVGVTEKDLPSSSLHPPAQLLAAENNRRVCVLRKERNFVFP